MRAEFYQLAVSMPPIREQWNNTNTGINYVNYFNLNNEIVLAELEDLLEEYFTQKWN